MRQDGGGGGGVGNKMQEEAVDCKAELKFEFSWFVTDNADCDDATEDEIVLGE